MADPKIWFPFYIGDYLADTIGLSNSEHGAYLLSICAYWRKGGQLTDAELKSSCRANKDYERIKQFYTRIDGHWSHNRINQELLEARERMRLAKEKSLKGVAARRKLGQLPKT